MTKVTYRLQNGCYVDTLAEATRWGIPYKVEYSNMPDKMAIQNTPKAKQRRKFATLTK